MNCPECGAMVSDLARRCPHCGLSVRDYVTIEQKVSGIQKQIWTAFALFVLVLFMFVIIKHVVILAAVVAIGWFLFSRLKLWRHLTTRE
ncbi:MAG: hypothetical protein HQM07_05255 [Zetaproteobacteria bacterium]|nr:hypothetical protein [Zetaproteobacteria bacterium]